MAGVVSRVRAYMRHCYLMYELNTSVYMLDGREKLLLNLTLLTLLLLLAYSSLVYLPPYLHTMLSFFLRTAHPGPAPDQPGPARPATPA